MKKIASVLLILAMLLSAACMAEESYSLLKQAQDIISSVNFIVNDNTGIEQLFMGYEELLEDEIYCFYTEDNGLLAVLMADEDKAAIDSCTMICDVPEALPMALNCVSLLPFAQLIVYGSDEESDALHEDMIVMAEWLDENRADVTTALENSDVYSTSYAESEFFHLDLMIVPMDEGTPMMAIYYFGAAEEAAE